MGGAEDVEESARGVGHEGCLLVGVEEGDGAVGKEEMLAEPGDHLGDAAVP